MNNDVTAAYIIMDVEHLRLPIQRITDYIAAQFSIKDRGQILPLQRQA